MDEINVIVEQQNINVIVEENPLNIQIAKGGIQGPPGISGQSGGDSGTAFVTFTGQAQNFITQILPTGFNRYFIQFPNSFTLTPKVDITIEVTGDYSYNAVITNRTTSGFMVLFSDYIAESGINLHTYTTVNN